MHAQLAASKITAFAVALMMNSLMILGVGYLFNEQSYVRAEATASVHAIAQLSNLVRA
jgi:hypothetical protein